MQLNLDLSFCPAAVDGGKKLADVNFKASAELKEFLTMFAAKQGTPRSELCNKYIIEGLQRDLGMMLITNHNANKPLSELLRR